MKLSRLLALTALISSGCASSGNQRPSDSSAVPAIQPSNPTGGDQAYQPLLFARLEVPIPRGTLQGDAEWARQAPTISEAIARWKTFVSQHGPNENGEWEDGAQVNVVTRARAELARAYYLIGDTAAADQMLQVMLDEGSHCAE